MKKTERKTKTTPVKIAGKPSALTETGSSSKDTEKEAENEVGEFPSLTEIKELIEFVSEKQFNEFELELGGFRLYWRKGLGERAAPSNQLDLHAPHPAGESASVETVSGPSRGGATSPRSTRGETAHYHLAHRRHFLSRSLADGGSIRKTRRRS